MIEQLIAEIEQLKLRLSRQEVRERGPKNNFAATTAPGVGDDSADGYQVGSRWVNTSTGNVYTCTNASVGSAVWHAD